MFLFVAGGCKCFPWHSVCAILHNFAVLENKCMYVYVIRSGLLISLRCLHVYSERDDSINSRRVWGGAALLGAVLPVALSLSVIGERRVARDSEG